MAEFEIADTTRLSRPSLAQVKAVVEFIQKHPNLAHRGLRHGVSYEKVKKLWIELSNIANSIRGAVKSTKGWIKFWSDKRRNIMVKQKQIKSGKIAGKLTCLEQKILDISKSNEKSRKSKSLKPELCNGDDNSIDDIPIEDENDRELQVDDRMQPTESDERHLNIMEKMIEAMDQQAIALAKIAQATVVNSKAMERMAEASHKQSKPIRYLTRYSARLSGFPFSHAYGSDSIRAIFHRDAMAARPVAATNKMYTVVAQPNGYQALAVDRLAGTFETINTSVYDVRNAVVSIDYTMKRFFSTNSTQHRQNANLFS